MEHEGSLQYSQKSKNGTYPEALQPKSHISKPVFKMEFNACSPKWYHLLKIYTQNSAQPTSVKSSAYFFIFGHPNSLYEAA